MPRKRNPDGVPKPPRVRKKKVVEEVVKEPSYEPLMQNGILMDDGVYTQDAFGYAFGSHPAQFDQPGPYIMQSAPSTASSQPIIMRQPMVPTSASMQVPSGQAPQAMTQPMQPTPTPLEYRIHDMNRRLYIFNHSGLSEKDHTQWWDAFSHEFFEDDARMVIQLCDQPQPETFVVNRQLIPRFFRSFFDSGAKELYFVIRSSSRESQSQTGIIQFENDNVLQVSKLDQPFFAEVQTECKLYIEFTPYDEILNYRIRKWTVELRTSHEFFLNELASEVSEAVPLPPDKGPLTRLGLSMHTLHCLSFTRILEPMQIIMSTTKSSGVEPRDAMRRQMFQQYQLAANMQHRAREMAAQQMMPPNAVEESKAKPARQRKRKPAANAKTKKTQSSPAAQNPSFPHNPMPTNFTSMGYQDVMVVGEPSMMGGDFGQQDERTISRIENTQYDPSSVRSMQGSMNGMQNMHGASNGMGMGGVPAGMGAMGAAQGLPMTSQSMSMPPMGPPSGQMTPSQVPSGQMTPVSMPPGSMAPPAHLTNLGGPPQNGMPPPGYTFANGQPGTWPGAPPNATMITG